VSGVNDINVGDVTSFRGLGEIVAVGDTGVDSQYPAFDSRIMATSALGRPDLVNDIDGHGTSVCEPVLG